MGHAHTRAAANNDADINWTGLLAKLQRQADQGGVTGNQTWSVHANDYVRWGLAVNNVKKVMTGTITIMSLIK